MSKYEINKLKDWCAGALHTHAPLGEMVRLHLHGGEKEPGIYYPPPLELMSDPAVPYPPHLSFGDIASPHRD